MDIEVKIRKFYEDFPYPSFRIEKKSDLNKLKFQKFLFELSKLYLNKRSRILDAGCGTGELTNLFASGGFDAWGADISEKSLQIAQGIANKLKVKSKYKKTDVLNLKFPKNSFNLVICNGVLHHTKNPLLGFENLVRVTKPGGAIMIVIYNKYGSFPRRLVGKIASIIVPGNKQNQVKFLRKIAGKKFASKSDPVIADTFLNPYETSFSIGEILSWFAKYKVKYKESAPPIEIEYYPPVFAELHKNRSLLKTWLKVRRRVGKAKFSFNYLSFLLVQLLWLLSLRGNIFLLIGEKRHG